MKNKESQGIANTSTSLVTGGAGFIGSHVAEYLIQLGHRRLR
jgi:nucleoside-diphosphate-sugar epimerase